MSKAGDEHDGMPSAQAPLAPSHQCSQFPSECPSLKHLCFLDLYSRGLITPGATPDLPSLPSDVLGVDRVQGAPGGNARWHPLLFAPYTLHSSSLCSHFPFLDSNQATPSLFAAFPVPPAPVPTPVPGKPPSLPPGARPGDQMLEESPGLTSHQAITPILQTENRGTEREGDFRAQTAGS